MLHSSVDGSRDCPPSGTLDIFQPVEQFLGDVFSHQGLLFLLLELVDYLGKSVFQKVVVHYKIHFGVKPVSARVVCRRIFTAHLKVE